MTPRRWLLTALSFGAAIGVSVWVIISGWRRDGGSTLALPLTAHALAALALGLEISLRALKLSISARALGVRLPFGVAARTGLGGDFAAALTPNRVGAEPARFIVLQEAGISVSAAIIVLFLELLLELISLVVIAFGLVIVLGSSSGGAGRLVGVVATYAVTVVALGTILLVLATRNANGPPPPIIRSLGVGVALWRKAQRGLRHVREGVVALRAANKRILAVSLLMSVLHILPRLMILPIIVWSFDSTVPVAPLIIWPMALLYGGAVVPAPGGGGVIEVGFSAALAGTIPAAFLGPALVWWRFYTFYAYIAIGAIAAGRTVMRVLSERRASSVER